MVFHNLPANHVIDQLRGGGGGGGVQAFHFGAKDFELGVGGEGQTGPEILRVHAHNTTHVKHRSNKQIGAKNKNLN